MKLISIFYLIIISLHAHSSSCSSYPLKGTEPGWLKSGVVSSAFALTTSLLVSAEAEEENDYRRTLPIYTAMIPFWYFYAGGALTCPRYTKKEFDEMNKRFRGRLKLRVPQSKEALDAKIEAWRIAARRNTIMLNGINLVSLSQIYVHAQEDSTKNYALAGAIATIITILYDYDEIYSEKDPPWVNFNVLPKKVGLNNYVPSANLTFRF
jgi:hypothetical protein